MAARFWGTFLPRFSPMRAVASLFLVTLSLALAGCDSGAAARFCEAGICEAPSSTFPQEDPLARQVEGRVVQGTEIVPDAVVQLEPTTPGFATDERLLDAGDPGWLTSTDLSGRYRIKNGPFFYDLEVRKDREVVVFRGLALRGFEPPLGADAPVRGYTARVSAAISPPPAVGHAVAFFVSGADARTVSGDASSLVATFRQFESVITLHAVEYVASGGLSTAVAAGRVDVRVTSGGVASAVVALEALDADALAHETRFVAVPPAGFALSSLEIVMDLGVRTSQLPVAHVAAGVPLPIGIIRAARYFVRASATHEGAISDSGRQFFDPFDEDVALILPPPITEATFDGGSGFSAVADKGVIEHLLVPAAPGGTSFRIATTDRDTTLPDLTRLGVPQRAGLYAWSVRHFPALKRIDNLSGEDVRVTNPVSTTAPHTIELR